MAIVNKCLAAYGGTLSGNAAEAHRDNNFTVAVNTINVNPGSGSYSSVISFPSCTINYVKWRVAGDWSGNNNAYAYFYIYYGGGWNVLSPSYVYGSRTPGSFDSGEATINGPWYGVTSVKVNISGDGSIGVLHMYDYEIQAWGPGPVRYAQII